MISNDIVEPLHFQHDLLLSLQVRVAVWQSGYQRTYVDHNRLLTFSRGRFELDVRFVHCTLA